MNVGRLMTIVEAYEETYRYCSTDQFDLGTYDRMRDELKDPHIVKALIWSGDKEDFKRLTYEAKFYWKHTNNRITRVCEITTENDVMVMGFIKDQKHYSIIGKYIDIDLVTNDEGMMMKPEVLKTILFMRSKKENPVRRRANRNKK